MTRTFQNGRERPTTCISDSLLRLQCMNFLHSGRERSQRLLLGSRTVTLAQRGAFGQVRRSRPLHCLFPSPCVETRISYLRTFSGHLFASHPLVGIRNTSSGVPCSSSRCTLSLIPLVIFYLSLQRSCNDMATNEQASG